MAQSRDIKNRITSVKKTQKITQAMKMVSAAKFKRASNRVTKARAYSKELEILLANIIASAQGTADTPYLKEGKGNKDMVIVISGDRGLCGGFNANINKFAKQFIKSHDFPMEVVCFGSKSTSILSKLTTVVETHYNFSETASVKAVEKSLMPVIKGFMSGTYRRVYILNNAFLSAVSSPQTQQQLLPISPKETSSVKEDYFYEPNQESVLESLCFDYLSTKVFQSLLESKAGEEGARMVAMDSATDNAKEMIKSLTLLYNRTRQAAITTELSEIVAGAEALVK